MIYTHLNRWLFFKFFSFVDCMSLFRNRICLFFLNHGFTMIPIYPEKQKTADEWRITCTHTQTPTFLCLEEDPLLLNARQLNVCSWCLWKRSLHTAVWCLQKGHIAQQDKPNWHKALKITQWSPHCAHRLTSKIPLAIFCKNFLCISILKIKPTVA